MKHDVRFRAFTQTCLALALAGIVAAGCGARVSVVPRPTTLPAQPAQPLAYTFACADGKSFEAVFEGESATVSFQGATRTLAQQISGSGIRYADDMWEFRGKGEEGMLMDAKTGDTLAGDCKAGPAQPSGILTGTVMYRQRIALAPAAVIEVQLQDISRADAPATILATQTITAAGKQVPIPFELTYDPGALDPRGVYAVSARITLNGKLIWTSATVNRVLTPDSPTTSIEVWVEPVSP